MSQIISELKQLLKDIRNLDLDLKDQDALKIQGAIPSSGHLGKVHYRIVMILEHAGLSREEIFEE